MASFTDNQPIRYREYVAQNPIEAMTMVGTAREQELKAGIQKVNEVRSRVAGVDLLRDVDKQYLSSSLNNMKTGITDNLTGDFSDQKIVNQITGAAARIYKDPIMQNAIASTAQVRAGQQEMNDARKKGENGPSNDYYFSKQVSSYLQDTNPETSFNYKYEKYSDVRKHTREIVKDLLPSGTTVDEAYDANGNLKESVIRNGFKGVKPDQIRAALRSGLSPQDMRQLELDGIYNYGNMPDQVFADGIQQRYSEIADTYKSKIDAIDNAVTTSAAEKANNDAIKANLLEELDKVKGEYEGVTSTLASGDTDSAKAKLNTVNYINQQAAALSHSEITRTIQGDTPQQMMKWRMNRATDWKKFMLTFSQNERFHADDMTEKALSRAQKDKELKQNEGYGSLGLPLSKEDVPTVTQESFTAITEGMQSDLNSKRDQFLKDNGRDPKDPKAQDWYAEREQAFETRPAALSFTERSHFQSTDALKKELNGNLQVAEDVRKAVEADPEYKKISDIIPKNARPLVYQEDANNKWTFTPEDFIEFNRNKTKYKKITGSPMSGTASVSYDFGQATMDNLSPKQIKLLEIDSKRSQTSAERQIADAAQQYNEAVNIPYKKELTRQSKVAQEELGKRLLIHQGTVSGIPLTNEAQKSSMDGVIADLVTYANQYSSGKIGDTNAEDLAKSLDDPNKQVNFITTPGNRYQSAVNKVIVTSKGKQYVVPITEEQKTNVFGNSYSQTPVQQSFKPIAEQMQKAGGITTQLGPKPYFTSKDFPSVTNYGVQGNLRKDRESGKYEFVLTITDPITKKTTPNIPVSSLGGFNESDVIQGMQVLSDQDIFKILNGRQPTAQELKALEVGVQKPF